MSVGHSEANRRHLDKRPSTRGLVELHTSFNAMPAMSARRTRHRWRGPYRRTSHSGHHCRRHPCRSACCTRPPSPAKDRSNIALVSDAMPTVGTEQDHFELMGRRDPAAERATGLRKRNACRRSSRTGVCRQKCRDAGGHFPGQDGASPRLRIAGPGAVFGNRAPSSVAARRRGSGQTSSPH